MVLRSSFSPECALSSILVVVCGMTSFCILGEFAQHQSCVFYVHCSSDLAFGPRKSCGHGWALVENREDGKHLFQAGVEKHPVC